MVTVGFIVEGYSEASLIKDKSFIKFLSDINILCSTEHVINATGKYFMYHPAGDFSNIQPDIKRWIKILKDQGVDKIIFLLDFDNSDPCFTAFKSKVFSGSDNIVVVAKQALEAWFLADTEALCRYLKKRIAPIENPEDYLVPFEAIKALRLQHCNSGISDKKLLTRHMVFSGFSLLRAAAHPNCPSATYFLNKLLALNTP